MRSASSSSAISASSRAHTATTCPPSAAARVADLLHERPFAGEVRLVDVGDVEHGLGGHQLQLAENLRRLRAVEREAADGIPRGEPRFAGREHLDAGLGVFVAGAGGPLGPLQHAFDRLQVGEHQLGVDRFDVADRVDGPFDVHHVGIGEAADDVQNRVDVADVGQELVAQPFALRRPADQPGNVDQLHDGRDDLLRFRCSG